MHIIDRAEGRWHDILSLAGVPERFLTGKHGPCPFCGGTDRFRFDNAKGTGSYYCHQCGPGWGTHFVMKFKKCSRAEAYREIENVVGRARRIKSKAQVASTKLLQQVATVWDASIPISAEILTEADDDSVRRYLRHRAIDADKLNITDVRQSSKGNMIALLRTKEGHPCQIQATLLSRDGDKADTGKPRLFLRGHIPDGAVVRLMRHDPEKTLGIAEGIETALSAAHLYGFPVWAAVNSSLLKKWMPPDHVRSITIFGDNDDNYTGQAAAYALANRLTVQHKCNVRVMLPRAPADWDEAKYDWNDEWSMVSGRSIPSQKERNAGNVRRRSNPDGERSVAPA